MLVECLQDEGDGPLNQSGNFQVILHSPNKNLLCTQGEVSLILLMTDLHFVSVEGMYVDYNVDGIIFIIVDFRSFVFSFKQGQK